MSRSRELALLVRAPNSNSRRVEAQAQNEQNAQTDFGFRSFGGGSIKSRLGHPNTDLKLPPHVTNY